MPADVSTAGKPKAGQAAKGGKVLGMPRRVAVIGGLAVLGGVAFIIWRNHQASAAGGQGSSADTTGGTGASGDTSALPDSSGVQGGGMQGATGTETLVIKIRELQGHKPGPKPKPKPKRFPHEPPPRRRMRPPHIVKGPVPPVKRGR